MCAATALLRSRVGAGVALECWPLDSEEASPRGWGDGLAAVWVLGLLWDPATPLLVTLGIWSPPRAQIRSVCEPESGRGCAPRSSLQVAVVRFHLSLSTGAVTALCRPCQPGLQAACWHVGRGEARPWSSELVGGGGPVALWTPPDGIGSSPPLPARLRALPGPAEQEDGVGRGGDTAGSGKAGF